MGSGFFALCESLDACACVCVKDYFSEDALLRPFLHADVIKKIWLNK